MKAINQNTTHVVGALPSLFDGRFHSQHQTLKAAKAMASWLRKNSSTHRKEGCEVWTREQLELARSTLEAA